MIAAVLVIRQLATFSPRAQLVVEVAIGAGGYLGRAWVIANATFLDVLDLARRALRRRT